MHIAFIPILVPPLLLVMNRLRLDRRAVACAITFSITVMYMTMPIGFGSIFLNDILVGNINKAGAASGFQVGLSTAPLAMLIPASGMVFGLALALLFSYRRPRHYQDVAVAGGERGSVKLGLWQRVSIGTALLLSCWRSCGPAPWCSAAWWASP